jgi:hypothetical protein
VFRSSANPEFPSLVLDYRCVPLIRMFSVIQKFHVKWFGVCALKKTSNFVLTDMSGPSHG